MKRIALLLAIALFATCFTGCGCLRRVRGTLCPGAFCGSRAPAPTPIVATPQFIQPQYVQQQQVQPQYIQPQVVQPQMAAPQCVPQCVPCCPQPCPCPCPCPTVCEPCCDPCCQSYGECGSGSYGGDSGYAAYGGDCGCDAPFGINVAPGEYLGGVEAGDSQWQGTVEPTDAGDPGPGT